MRLCPGGIPGGIISEASEVEKIEKEGAEIPAIEDSPPKAPRCDESDLGSKYT